MNEMRKIVLLLNTTRMYTRGLLRGIAQYGHLQGQWVFYRPLDYREPTPPRALVKVLAGLKPDGIFMREPDQMRQIIEMGIPTVSFPYTVETIEGIANVVANHVPIGEMAARHLLDRGFRHFAY